MGMCNGKYGGRGSQARAPRALLPSALLQHLVQPHPRLLQEQERCWEAVPHHGTKSLQR